MKLEGNGKISRAGPVGSFPSDVPRPGNASKPGGAPFKFLLDSLGAAKVSASGIPVGNELPSAKVTAEMYMIR